MACFCLAAHLIVRADLPPKVGRGGPDAIPAVLFARLALDLSLRGQGLGGELPLDALSRAVAASEVAAARLVVDAMDETAAAFMSITASSPCPVLAATDPDDQRHRCRPLLVTPDPPPG